MWLPLATLAGFALLAAADLVAFPDAVLAVTFLAALAWVAVGLGGDRIRGPFESERGVRPGPRGGDDPGRRSGGVDATTGVLAYLTVTAALGWAALSVFVGL